MRRRLLATPEPRSPQILQQVRDWLEGHPDLKTIALYSPLPGEVDVTPLVAGFPAIRWVFPRIEGSELVLHEVTDIGHDLESGAFDIREPRSSLPVVDFFHVDAFVCPGLAFDAYGGRLGRGRGFYDRMLAKAREGALKIGLCRQEQLVPDTFAEPHDIVMDQVISA